MSDDVRQVLEEAQARADLYKEFRARIVGKLAFMLGLTQNDNPYPPGPERDAWSEGLDEMSQWQDEN